MRILSIATLLLAPAVWADTGSHSLLDEDFREIGLFAERWSTTGQRSRTKCENGRVKLPNGGLDWKGALPLEYVIELTLANYPDWAEKPENWDSGPRWAGIESEFGIFTIASSGCAAVIGKLPGQQSAWGRYPKLDGYESGKPVTIRLERRKIGTQLRYVFDVNGKRITEYVAPMPQEFKPLRIFGLNIAYEVCSVKVWEVRGADSSPNTLVNSGFEYDEDGIPPFVQFVADFDFKGRPLADYENRFVNRVSVDPKEFHSGRQSLRFVLNDTSSSYSIRPFGAGTAEGQKGVFSVWMKADRPDIAATLRYGSVKQPVKLSTEWRRYEVYCPSLGKPWVQSCAGIEFGRGPAEGATVWIDDWQAEFTEGERATPYRPADTDMRRFEKPSGRTDKVANPRPLSASRSALNGYPLKHGETLVLGRLDYYMSEPEARFRIWNERGDMEEVAVDIRGLPTGVNQVQVKAHGRIWPAEVVKRPFRAQAGQINNFTRSIIHDGKPVLLSAVCSTSGQLGLGNKAFGDRALRMTDLLMSAGFKQQHIMVWGAKDCALGAAEMLDYGAKRGMVFDVWTDETLSRLGDMSEAVFWDCVDRPNVCVRQILDEPELRHDSAWGLERMQAANRRFPYAVVMMNNSTMGLGQSYAGLLTDVFMVDNYLTNSPDGRSVEEMLASVDTMLRTRPGTPAWMFLVSNNLTLHYKSPSYGEQVAQSWGSICSGATGISWYLDLPTTEPCWRAMRQVNREVQELAPMLLSDTLCGTAAASVGSRSLRHLTRRYSSDFYVFACNVDQSPLDAVEFVLPEDAPRSDKVEVLYENRMLPIKDGRFKDDFAGYARHIYRVSK